MAAHIPVLVLTGALKAIQQQTASRQEHNRSRVDLERHAMDLARLRMEARQLEQQHQRQADMLLRLADLSADMTRMQLASVMEVFHGIREVLLNHQSILGAEKAAISQANLGGTLDGAQFVLRMKRQKEIDRELAAISAAAMQLADTAFSVIAQIEPDMRQGTRQQIEALRDVSIQ